MINIGTGLRAGVMVHLPALTISQEIASILNVSENRIFESVRDKSNVKERERESKGNTRNIKLEPERGGDDVIWEIYRKSTSCYIRSTKDITKI